MEADLIDDGCGFLNDACGIEQELVAGQGLRHMRERANEVGAHLEIISHPGGGTRVLLRCPLRPGHRMTMR